MTLVITPRDGSRPSHVVTDIDEVTFHNGKAFFHEMRLDNFVGHDRVMVELPLSDYSLSILP